MQKKTCRTNKYRSKAKNMQENAENGGPSSFHLSGNVYSDWFTQNSQMPVILYESRQEHTQHECSTHHKPLASAKNHRGNKSSRQRTAHSEWPTDTGGQKGPHGVLNLTCHKHTSMTDQRRWRRSSSLYSPLYMFSSARRVWVLWLGPSWSPRAWHRWCHRSPPPQPPSSERSSLTPSPRPHTEIRQRSGHFLNMLYLYSHFQTAHLKSNNNDHCT